MNSTELKNILDEIQAREAKKGRRPSRKDFAKAIAIITGDVDFTKDRLYNFQRKEIHNNIPKLYADAVMSLYNEEYDVWNPEGNQAPNETLELENQWLKEKVKLLKENNTLLVQNADLLKARIEQLTKTINELRS